jgi:hypothetical protein
VSNANRWFGGVVLVLCAACSDVSRFDTGKDDAYCGTVVNATFVREGFTRLIQAELQIDTSALNTRPGQLTSHRDDSPCDARPLFDAAPLRPPIKLESDALSQLQFGDDREMNWMSWVQSSCDETYLAVVSLMHDNSVELRLLRSPTVPSDPETGALGVFILERNKRGCGND